MIRTKDQSGAAASGEFLAQNGGGTYGARAKGKSVQGRVTRPIRKNYFLSTVAIGLCRCCAAKLVIRKNPNGGSFYTCSLNGPSCFYIGWRYDEDRGEEKVI